MKKTIQKMLALLLAVLTLFSLCACGADDSAPTTEENNTTAGAEKETTAGDNTESGDNTATDGGATEDETPVVPEDPNAVNCYFSYYDLKTKPSLTIKVSSNCIEEGYVWGTRHAVNISREKFVTDEIIERAGDRYYFDNYSQGCLELRIYTDENTYVAAVEIDFIDQGAYETIVDENSYRFSTYTSQAGHIYNHYTDNHGNAFYLLDLGIDGTFVLMKQSWLSASTGTEFETVTFEVIRN